MRFYDENLSALSALFLSIQLMGDKLKNKSGRKKISGRLEKEIRSFINSYDGSFPEEINKKLSADRPIEDIVEFLDGCNKKFEEFEKARDSQWQKVINDFDDGVKRTFNLLKEDFGIYFAEFLQNETRIVFAESFSYTRILILHSNVKNTAEKIFSEVINTRWCEIEKNKDGYCFEALIFDRDEPVEILFDSAQVGAEVYSAVNSCFEQRPPENIISISEEIYRKSLISNSLLNVREKEIFPLIEFLTLFHNNYDVCINEDGRKILCSLAQKQGRLKIKRIAERLSEKNRERYGAEFCIELCKPDNEPLWRDIFNMLQGSQKGYPIKTEKLCDREILEKTRISISEVMYKNGFTGEYPDFYKKSKTEKCRLLNSYYISYFTGRKKDIDCYVKCAEIYGAFDLTVEFLCGTAFSNNKNGSRTVEDIYSCTFDAEGKRFFKTLTAFVPKNEEKLKEFPNIKSFAEAAAKSAELKKLSKEEKNNLYYQSGSLGCFGVIFLFLFTGILFSALMTIGFMLIEFVAALIITGSINEFGDLFIGTPWWKYFLFMAVLFGGGTAAFTVLSYRN